MKKLILIFFILSLFIPFMGYAAKGDCSCHGGIDCNAGADWDGSVICNDGWKDSIDSYSDAVECQSKKYFCTTKQLYDLYAEYKIQEKMNELGEIKNQMIQLKSAYNDSIAETENSGITIGQARGELSRKQKKFVSESTALEAKAAIIKDQYNSAQRLIGVICESLGEENHRKKQQELQDLRLKQKQIEIDKKLGYSKELLNILTCANMNALYKDGKCTCFQGFEFNQDKTTCVFMCPINSLKIGDRCICDEGYVLNDDTCISYTQSCQLKYGLNSYGDKQYCHCSAGYEFNGSKTACTKKKIKIIQHSSGTLIKTVDSGGVFKIENGRKRPIKSAEIFLAKGYQWKDIVEVSEAEMDSYILGSDVTIDENNKDDEISIKQQSISTLPEGMLVRAKNSNGVYLIRNNKKRPIKSAEIFLGRGYKWGDVVDVKQSVLNVYPLGESVTLLESITTEDKTQTITINVPRLRVRSLPGTNGKIVATVSDAQEYNVIEESNGWYKINYESGKTGWVIGIYTK